MSKTRPSCFIRGSRHLETIKALGLRPRAFICFSVSGSPDKTLALVFDKLLENYALANFCHIYNFRQIGHYRQNRYFGRRPFAISFDLFILLWRIYAIFKVFVNVPFLLIHFPGKVLHLALFRNKT